MIDRVRFWKTLAMSWMFTLMSLFCLAVVTLIIGFIAIRFLGSAAVIAIFMPSLAFMIFVFLISEVIVNRVFDAEAPDSIRDQVFIEAHDRITKKTRMWIKPRARILKVGSPNAMAYGMGFPGLCSVGISRELLNLLTPEEVEAVLGHEFAHIRCRDVGLMTIIGLLHTFTEKFSRALLKGRSAVMGSVFVFAIVWVIAQIAKGIFSLAKFAISQERELAADALGACYIGTPAPLISALRKLHASRPTVGTRDMFDETDARTGNPFADIMISHPGLSERIASLESILTSAAKSPQGAH